MTHRRPHAGKWIYYFYFIDEVLRLCFLRVPTWCPFARTYVNGHNWLASKLRLAVSHSSYQDHAHLGIRRW
jgi:hypothetical protein